MVNKLSLKKEHKKIVPIVIAAIIILVLAVLFFVQIFKHKVAIGDTVTVDYTGYYENGTIFDTNIQDVALKAGIHKDAYQSFTFVLGQNQVIPGFEEQVIGMAAGEKKTFTVTPDKGYGNVRDELIVHDLKRNLNVTRYSYLTRDVYKKVFNKDPQVGETLQRRDIPWQLQVVDVNDTNVKVENILNFGQTVNMSGAEWSSVVVAVTNDTITLKQNPEVGNRLSFPARSGTIVAVVINVSDNTFDVNANHPLAGMNLTFDVTIKNIKKSNT